MRVKCLAQEHNSMSPARARTRTARSGDERTNHEATAPPPGAASRERKLTMILFIVTFVSMLMWLPYVLSSFLVFATDIFSSLSSIAFLRLNITLIALYHANSLVNPILYAARMPHFRRALVAVFCKRPQQLNQAPVIPLRDM